MRRQLSHWKMISLRRSSFTVCGLSRIWQAEQRPPRTGATADVLRYFSTRSKSARTGGLISAASAARSAASVPMAAAASTSWVASAARSASIAACSRAKACSACFDLLRHLVELDHLLEQPVFVLPDLVLGGLDLLLHRLVFAVRLDLHELVPELREPGLLHGEFLLDLAPGGLVGGQARALVLEGLAGGLEGRRQLLLAGGLVGDGPARPLGGVLDLLEVNDPFEIRMHGLWWAHQDSNLGQAGYEPAALTAELWARISLL